MKQNLKEVTTPPSPQALACHQMDASPLLFTYAGQGSAPLPMRMSIPYWQKTLFSTSGHLTPRPPSLQRKVSVEARSKCKWGQPFSKLESFTIYIYIYIHDTSINLKRFSSPTCPAATKDEINGPPGRAGVPSEAHHGIGLAHLWKKGSDGFIISYISYYHPFSFENLYSNNLMVLVTNQWLSPWAYMEKWSQDGYLIGKFYRISGESGEIIGN